MKNTFLVVVLSCLLFSLQMEAFAIKTQQIKVKAPFAMPAITVPDFKDCKTFNIANFGAIPGNKDLTTEAIAKAIDQANKIGGGIVMVPPGVWLTGQIHLKSNVNLHLSKGAQLLFSEKPSDYLPEVHSSWEGLECYNYSPLIYAYQCQNVAITGQGEIKAKMDIWKIWGARPSGHMNSLKRLYYLSVENVPVTERMMVNDTAHLRPQFIQFNRSENILLEGIHITNSPFWTIHLYLSKNIVVRNVKVFAHDHNNDGIDPEMSQNVLIEDCVFDQGDDAIAVKSGRNPEGWRSKTPSKNIVIRNCIVKNGHQLMAIGSELSGGIENIYLQHCRVDKDAKMFHIVYIKTNERMGGYVKNIFANDVRAAGKMGFGILGIETDVLYQWKTLVPTLERRLTPISNIYLKNVKANQVKFIARLLGQKELPIENVFLQQVGADTIQGQKNILENVKNFSFKN
ncbi:MAG TPA: glycoside hydrolase family 28 protein [Bacteroidales bacterium]|nr:glycoside hydrolase family 28 protein [Bacteroidales bacterium]